MEKTARPNRIREALGQLQEQQPPYFREYLRRFQEDPTSRVFAPLAEAYRRLGRYDEAIAICIEGLEHHPDFHGGRVVLAKCYMAKNQQGDARAELERVVHAVPENLMGQRLLGDVYLALGNRASALHCYKMALLLAPADVALCEKVHDLEAGASPLISHDSPADPVDILPLSKDELEVDMPPFWANEAAPVREPVLEGGMDVVTTQSMMVEPGLGEGLQLLPTDDEHPIDDEAFKVGSIGALFDEQQDPQRREITTETLGDLYFSQGQFDKALRIFEKLKPLPKVKAKIEACRGRLGVDPQSRARSRKIALLRSVVHKARGKA